MTDELERWQRRLERERLARKEAERGLKKLLGDKADNDAVKGVADQLLKGLFK